MKPFVVQAAHTQATEGGLFRRFLGAVGGKKDPTGTAIVGPTRSLDFCIIVGSSARRRSYSSTYGRRFIHTVVSQMSMCGKTEKPKTRGMLAQRSSS